MTQSTDQMIQILLRLRTLTLRLDLRILSPRFFILIDTDILQYTRDHIKLAIYLVALLPEPVQSIHPYRMFRDPPSVHTQETNLMPIFWDWRLKGMGENVSYLEQPGKHRNNKRKCVGDVIVGIH